MSGNIAYSLVTFFTGLETWWIFQGSNFTAEMKKLSCNFLFPQIITVEVFLPISLRTNDEIVPSKYYLREQLDFSKFS